LRRAFALALAVTVTAAATETAAETDPDAETDPEPEPEHSVWIVLARTTVVGLGVGAVGGIPLGVLYGSDRVTPWAVPFAVAGSGILISSGAGAIWALVDGADRAGVPGALAPVQVDAGLVWVADPLLAPSALARVGGAWHTGRLRLAPHALFAVDDDEQRVVLDAGWRTYDTIEARATATYDRLGANGFTLYTVEATARGRLDLARLHSRLRGAFVDGELGYGVEHVAYADGTIEATDVLVARFGFGSYVGCGRGEVSGWYDHRRDDLAGGFPAWRAAGFFGSVGVSGAYDVSRRWGVVAEAQFGSAVVSTLALRWRPGSP
jgi:hypothetical protein